MKTINISLKKEIIIYIIILLVSALLLLGAVLIKINEKDLLDKRILSSELIISSIKFSITNRLREKNSLISDLSNDYYIKNLINAFSNYNSYISIKIVDRDANTILSNRLETKKDIPKDLIKKRILLREKSFLRLENFLIITEPVFHNRKAIGAIVGNINISGLEKENFDKWILVIIFIAIDVLIFSIFGAYLLSKAVVTPITNLMNASEAVGRGDFNFKVKIESENEIGRLSRAFNIMVKSLKDKLTLINNKNIELENAKDEIIMSEKLATAGILSAGVAHEIGNPLSSIKTYIELLIMDEKDDDVKDILSRMNDEAKRIDYIVRDLINFSEPSKGKISKTDINLVIKNTVKRIKDKAKFKNIKFIFSLAENLQNINIDINKFEQVIINLLLNSSDAMPKGGNISISTLETDDNISNSKVIKIYISDTGEGIKDEYMDKIFDPFFTTKDPGQGTGLGLSIVNRIVGDMGGKVEVRNNEDIGTKFTISFVYDLKDKTT